jgi:hypothetical protein
MLWICNKHRGKKQWSVRSTLVVWWQFHKLALCPQWIKTETVEEWKFERRDLENAVNICIMILQPSQTFTEWRNTYSFHFCQILSEVDAISMHLPCIFMRRPFCLSITSLGAATKHQYERHRQYNARTASDTDHSERWHSCEWIHADRDECPDYKEQVPASELRGTTLTQFVKTLRLIKTIKSVNTPEHFQQGVPHLASNCEQSLSTR